MQKQIKQRKLLAPLPLFSDEISPLLQRIYALRGVKSQQELDYAARNLLSYEKLGGISSAVDLLYVALSKQQNIVIVGDFDTDGATSTALVVRSLRNMGATHVNYLIPDRFEDGYGLSIGVVKKAIAQHVELIITVDNGISSFDAVNYAKQHNIKVIITDHHLAPDVLPLADAIINPNVKSCSFPSKNLAGVGVSFYFMLALRAKLRQENWFLRNNIAEYNLANLLDLVALGTVADVVKLDVNNRILVHQGICRIRAGVCCAGIKALFDIARRDRLKLSAQDLGFYIAPRLNAAGRMDKMALGVELLLCDDDSNALALAKDLDMLNNERRTIEQTMHQEALKFLEQLESKQPTIPNSLVVYHPEWHQGIIGILSSRLKDKYHRPVISFAATGDGFLKGSGRSIKGVHLRDILDTIAINHPKLILSFGGHAMAAGLTIQENNLALFTNHFELAISKIINKSLLEPTIETDGEVDSCSLTYEIAKQLKDSGPWGEGFPEPLFDGDFILHKQTLIAEKHLKIVVSPCDSVTLVEGILFNANLEKWPDTSIQKIKLVYQLDPDEFRGNQSAKLIVRHIEALT